MCLILLMSLSTGVKNPENPAVLVQAAIAAALTSRWQEAVKINGKILTNDRGNVEALNRLARAYSCLGQTRKAQNLYKKVLDLDPFNIIALKNVEKLAKSNNHGNGHTNGSPRFAGKTSQSDLNGEIIYLPQLFLDEPGKTKLVNLLNLAPPTILATLSCGEQLQLNPKNHALTVSSRDGTYVGAFPDDLAHRLLAFISGGNEYEAYVRSSTTKSLIIFVRETKRSNKFGNQPSFASHASLFEDDNR